MANQTSYQLQTNRAYDGLKADLNTGTDVSKTIETAPVPFGRLVSEGSTNEKAVLGGSAPLGIVARQLQLEGGIPQVGERVDVRTDGPIFALVDGAGSKGDALTYDSVTGILSTGAVAGDIKAIANGSIVLSFDKADNASEVDNIVRVEIKKIG